MDEVNRKIVSHLLQDGRMALEGLARSVGYTSMGIKKRIQKLQAKDVMRVSALLNPFALGLHPAIVLLELESTEAVANLLNRFKDCPRVVHIFRTIGGYNVIALVIAENQDTLESISIEKCSLRSSTGIRRSEFYPIGDICFSRFISIREHLTHRGNTIAPCNVDCRPCARYMTGKCVGCPATSHYRGTL